MSAAKGATGKSMTFFFSGDAPYWRKREPCPPHDWEEADAETLAWQNTEYLLICSKCKERWPDAV